MVVKMKNKRVKDHLHESAEAGFTIIESLAAIVIVTLLMVGITPVLGIAVATRVQARRVELGSQAARSYVDRLRSESDTAQHPTPVTTSTTVPAPTPGALTCSDRAYCTVPAGTRLYCVDGDGDGSCTTNSVTDMVVQGVAYNDRDTIGATADNGYQLLARVYRADAFRDTTPLATGRIQASFTGGEGDRKAPIVELVTEISTDGTTYQDYCDRLNPASVGRNDACD